MLSRDRLNRTLNDPDRSQTALDVAYLNELGFALEWVEMDGHRYLVDAASLHLGTKHQREALRRRQKEAAGMVAASLVLGLPPFDEALAELKGLLPFANDRRHELSPEFDCCWAQEQIITELLHPIPFDSPGTSKLQIAEGWEGLAQLKAQRVATLLRELWRETAMRIFVDSGTTSDCIISFLRDTLLPSPYSALLGLTVCTNSRGIFNSLGTYEVPIKSIIVGGTQLGMTETIAGPLAELFLEKASVLNFSVALVGATMLDLRRFVCCSDTSEEQVIKQKVFERAQLRVVVVDDSKLTFAPTRESYRFAAITPEQIDLIITNLPVDNKGNELDRTSESVERFRRAVTEIRRRGVPVLIGRLEKTTVLSEEYARGKELRCRISHDNLDRFQAEVEYAKYSQTDAMERFVNQLFTEYWQMQKDAPTQVRWITQILDTLRGRYKKLGLDEMPGLPAGKVGKGKLKGA